MDFVENPHANGTAAAVFLAILKRRDFMRNAPGETDH
jgi:hypothetical protein